MLIIEKLNATDDNFFYLYEYHSYNLHGTNVNATDKRIMDIKSNSTKDLHIRKKQEAIEYFLNEITKVIKDDEEDIVVVVVPSSKVNNVSQGIKVLCKSLCKNRKLIDGTECLVRIIDIEPQHEGGVRNEKIHLDTIELSNKELIKGKKILLIDDVTTSGGTFRACKEILIEGSPKEVHCLAIGKSV